MVKMFFLLTHLRLQGEGKKEKERSKFVLSNQKSRKELLKVSRRQAGLETQAEGQDIAVRLRSDLPEPVECHPDHLRVFLHVRVVMLTSRDRFG